MSPKGEHSRAEIDRGWPYQVALPAEATVGARYDVVHGFCKGLSLCLRRHTFNRNGEWMNIFCFAEEEHAERFRNRLPGFIACERITKGADAMNRSATRSIRRTS